MPHCTADYPWYITKFAIGFASIVFFYMGFLKEKEFSCVCGPRKRLWEKNGAEKRDDRCFCRQGFDNPLWYGCGCKRNIASEELDETCIKERKSSIVVDEGAGGCCCSRKRR